MRWLRPDNVELSLGSLPNLYRDLQAFGRLVQGLLHVCDPCHLALKLSPFCYLRIPWLLLLGATIHLVEFAFHPVWLRWFAGGRNPCGLTMA